MERACSYFDTFSNCLFLFSGGCILPRRRFPFSITLSYFLTPPLLASRHTFLSYLLFCSFLSYLLYATFPHFSWQPFFVLYCAATFSTLAFAFLLHPCILSSTLSSVFSSFLTLSRFVESATVFVFLSFRVGNFPPPDFSFPLFFFVLPRSKFLPHFIHS